MTRPIHLLALASHMIDMLDRSPAPAPSSLKKLAGIRPEDYPPEIRAAHAAAVKAWNDAQISAAEAKRARRNAARLKAKIASLP